MKLLAIDDLRDNLVTLGALVKTFIPDAELLTAQSGEAGIALARTEQPDTILLDIHMPGLDGYDTTRHLKADEQTRHIPVILLTAQATSSASKVRGLESGADAFLAKPIDESELVAQIKAMVRIKRSEDALRRERDRLELEVAKRVRELDETQRQNRRLLDAIPHTAMLVDKQRRVIALNRTAAETGMKIGDYCWSGKNNWPAVPEYQRQAYLDSGRPLPGTSCSHCRFEEAFRLGESITMDVELLGRSWSLWWIPIQDDIMLHYSMDITDRKRTERALKESEDKYRTLFNNAQVGLFRVRASDSRPVEINQRYAAMAGYDSVEDCLADMVVSERYADQTVREETRAELLAKGEIKNAEARIRRKDGSLVWIIFSAQHNAENDFFEGAMVDVTDRKRAEEHLRVMEAIINRGPVILFLWKQEPQGWLVEHVSENVETILGYAVDDFTSSRISWLDIIHPDDVHLLSSRAVHAKDDQWSMEYRLLTKAGDIRWMRDQSMALSDPTGAINRIQAIVIDITEKKSAEEALRKNEEKYRLLFENAGEAIFVAQKGTVKFANPQTHEIINGTMEEITSRPFTDFIHPDDRQMVLERHRQRLDGIDSPSSYEFRLIRNSGEICDVELKAVLIEWEGQPATLNFLSDITFRKRADEEKDKLRAQLQQAQKMEAIGTLAGGVAHDFNNILQVINGYTQVMLLDRNKSDQDYPNLTAIEKAGARAAQLIKQLLLFSRKVDTERKPIDLNREIEQARKIIERTIPKMVEIRFHRGSELWAIRADPIQIEQVILNLSGNAADAMPDGGIPGHRNGKQNPGLGLRIEPLGGQTGQLCPHDRLRYRAWHGQKDPGADIRAVFYDQGNREGHRIGPGLGLWHRQKPRRVYHLLQRTRPGDNLQDLSSGHRACG